MIDKLNFDNCSSIVIPDFCSPKECADWKDKVGNFASFSPHKKIINGKVGAAFERLQSAYFCYEGFPRKEISPFIKILKDRVHTIAPDFDRDLYNVCFSAVKLNPLDGMTSHRDFSYNKHMLTTLVLEGSVLFGTGAIREEAYSSPRILGPGNLIALRAPAPDEKDFNNRPYFCVFALEPSILIRSWIRDRTDGCQYECRGDEYYGQ